MAMFRMFDPWLSSPSWGVLGVLHVKTRQIGAKDKVEKFQLDDDFDYDNCILDLKLDKKLHRTGAAVDGSEIWWLQKVGEFSSQKFIGFYIS